MRSYQGVLEKSVSQEKWHCTMLFLGNADLSAHAQEIITQPIRQSFHPVITILSLGEGKKQGQLWAYVQIQAFLHEIRRELMQRVEAAEILLSTSEQTQELVPHIHIGTLILSSAGATVPDIPVKTVFSLPELVLLKSNSDASYEQLARIPITP